MNPLFTNILTIIGINGAILLIPGANFLLIIRHATEAGRIHALNCALGITVAIMLHVLLAYYFVGYVLTQYNIIFECVKYMGATYLLYLAYRSFQLKPNTQTNTQVFSQKPVSASFTEGFLIDLLNPFVSFFYISLLATFVKTSSIFEVSVYFTTIFLLTMSWFGIVGVLSSTLKIRNYFIKRYSLLNKFAGSAFIWFSFKLATTHLK